MKNGRAEVKVPWNDDFVTVIYNPRKTSPAFFSQLAAAEKTQKLGYWIVSYLKELILGWDLMLDADTVAPLTEEQIADLPFEFLNKLEEMMRERAVPNAKNTSASVSIS